MGNLPPLEKRKMDVEMAEMTGSRFRDVMAEDLEFDNVNLSGTKIHNANLSNLHIEDAQIGGAVFRNIGLPPEGHPNYDPNAKKHQPVTFNNCNLSEATISEADLSGVEIKNCNIKGLNIDGILIEDLIKNHKKSI